LLIHHFLYILFGIFAHTYFSKYLLCYKDILCTTATVTYFLNNIYAIKALMQEALNKDLVKCNVEQFFTALDDLTQFFGSPFIGIYRKNPPC